MERLSKCKKFLLIWVMAGTVMIDFVLALGSTEAAELSGHINANGGGAWVMAIDESLPTRPRTIVVSDKNQFYRIQDLANKKHTVLGRAYGCRDRWIRNVSPGSLDITLECNISAEAEAEIYPASYWASIIHFPGTGDFPGTGTLRSGGNGIRSSFEDRAAYISQFYTGCHLCHQVGGPAARRLTSAFLWDKAMRLTKTPHTPGFPPGLDPVPPHIGAPADTRSQSGGGMFSTYRGFSGNTADNDTGLLVDSPDGKSLPNQFATMMEDWATRIANGEVPPAPPRPKGKAAQVVIQEWDTGTRHSYQHDGISTYKEDPTVNPNGVVWAIDIGQDYLWGTNPVTHEQLVYKVPMLPGYNKGEEFQHVPWCDQPGFCTWSVYDNPANPHTISMDANGLVWFTSAVARNQDRSIPGTPGFIDGGICDGVPPLPYNGAFHPRAGVAAFDPVSETFFLINTCGGTHHLAIDPADQCVWLSGDSNVLHRWCPAGLPDVGTYDYWEITADNIDGLPRPGFLYGINVAPDGTVWAATPGHRGRIIHFDPDCDRGALGLPPRASSTGDLGCTKEYVPPAPGSAPRGIDIDTNGVVHTGLGGSNHLGLFDESTCTTPECTEGWTLIEFPGPRNQGPNGEEIPASERGPADWYYYNFVDKFNASGLGANTSFVCGTGSDSIKAYLPTGEKIEYRIPYPLGTFCRLLDARIDDPSTCKGRGLWVANGHDPARFVEGGQPQFVHMWFKGCEID